MKKNLWKKRSQRALRRPSLRFSPYAWGKLLFLRDRGETEIGGFGLASADDPLLIHDILTVRQQTTVTTVAFDDAAVADLFDELVDQGLQPEQFGRVWIHTHPGNCPLPSSVDEATFRRVFGRTDWSVMAIVARNDASYARLSFHVGPGGALDIPVRVDYGQPFAGTDVAAWEQEYVANVVVANAPLMEPDNLSADLFAGEPQHHYWDWEDFYDGAPRAGSV